LFEHTLSTVENYHALLSRLIGGQGIPEKGDVMIREALDELGRFSDPIAVYFNEEITPRRSKSALAYLGALLHEVGKATTATAGDDERWQSNHHTEVGAELADQATKRLQLSNAESDWVRRLVRGHLLLQPFVESGSPPDRRAIFRFYKETGDAGVAIVLHTLADRLSTLGMEVDPGRWGAAISVAGVLLSAWWDQHEMVVSPQPLLDGHDLQQIFGLEPGPRIGRLLSQLIEAQASGAIHTTEEALDFVRQRLET
jgi:poly(A) polymerase